MTISLNSTKIHGNVFLRFLICYATTNHVYTARVISITYQYVCMKLMKIICPQTNSFSQSSNHHTIILADFFLVYNTCVGP